MTTNRPTSARHFVVTDPVSHPARHRKQVLFGTLVGAVIFVVRTWGNYPDGIAFAVLLANAATPFLDRLARTQEEARDPAAG